MTKLNWDRVHTEDRDFRHSVNLDLRKDISVWPPVIMRTAWQSPESQNVDTKREPYQNFKLCFQFEFTAPDGIAVRDWMIIRAIPQTMSLLSEKQAESFIQRAVEYAIGVKQSRLKLRTIQTDAAFSLQLVWPRPVVKSVTHAASRPLPQIVRPTYRVDLNIRLMIPIKCTSKEWDSVLSICLSSFSERNGLEWLQWLVARDIDAGVNYHRLNGTAKIMKMPQ